MNVPLAANGPIDLPAEYTITVMTPHGECTISGKANRLKFVKRYDRIDVRYQLSRRHPEDRRLRGKLIR
jgi:hypothetical protein